jgi:hypothetical protein
MRLWTWHKPDFSLLDGHVDHKLSEYVQKVDGVREAYLNLSSHLSTDQFIWCYTKPNQRIILPHHSEVEWILEVPTVKILAFIDDIVWNRILGIRCGLPRELELRWKDESISRHPYDPNAAHKFVKLRRDEFWNQTAPLGGWWSLLFVDERSDEFVSAIVPHPVHNDWVVSNPTPRCARTP